MAGPKKLTLRVQSAEGTVRVEVLESESTATLYERVHGALRLRSFAFALHRDRAKGAGSELASSKSRRLKDLGLRHGDMLFLSPVDGADIFEKATETPENTPPPLSTPAPGEPSPSTSRAPLAPPPATPAGPAPAAAVAEDDVDLELYQAPGHIQRQRDDKLCRHNSKGCCVHCSPLEPWDEGYLRDHNIKHMSFHSYLRKITSGKFVSLEELSCKIKPGCKEHPPWPRGICSACQPGAVTLTRQPYRHVDNVLLEHAAMVERFLGFWRASGHQRVAFLYGRYESHPDVPLGIRARVAAIYEPPQSTSRDHVALSPDAKAPLLDALAQRLRLRRVGWLFTDLIAGAKPGEVKQVRGVDTHFLSAQECITAGHFQNLHPNACRHAPKGYFGSKFVTVCVTGSAQNQVELEGYQVSGQCAALVRDNILLPTRDAPDLGYIRDSQPDQYVPDVYYKERDSYGNEVGVSAKRLPVAYLLVDVPCGVASAQGALDRPLFTPTCQFPPAHRPLHDQLQTLRALHLHLQSCPSFLEAVSDLHVLLYLASNEALPLTMEQLQPLLAAVLAKDADAAEAWRVSPAFATLEHLAAAAAEHEGLPAASDSSAGLWTCPLCTFHNSARRDACEMCAMPRNNA